MKTKYKRDEQRIWFSLNVVSWSFGLSTLRSSLVGPLPLMLASGTMHVNTSPSPEMDVVSAVAFLLRAQGDHSICSGSLLCCLLMNIELNNYWLVRSICLYRRKPDIDSPCDCAYSLHVVKETAVIAKGVPVVSGVRIVLFRVSKLRTADTCFCLCVYFRVFTWICTLLSYFSKLLLFFN